MCIPVGSIDSISFPLLKYSIYNPLCTAVRSNHRERATHGNISIKQKLDYLFDRIDLYIFHVPPFHQGIDFAWERMEIINISTMPTSSPLLNHLHKPNTVHNCNSALKCWGKYHRNRLLMRSTPPLCSFEEHFKIMVWFYGLTKKIYFSELRTFAR